MIEIAYVEDGNIDPDDICRISQGGKIAANGDEITLDKMREQGLLEL